MKKFKKYTGFSICVLGLVFNVFESLYFGNWTTMNFFPKSIPELACDYISLILVIFGCLRMMYDLKKN